MYSAAVWGFVCFKYWFSRQGDLASLWPDLLLFRVALGKAVSSWEQWAAGKTMCISPLRVKALKKCFPGVAGPPSSFPFRLISIPVLFYCSQPVLQGSLAQALLAAAAAEAEGVAWRMENCKTDAFLVKSHLKTLLCFHNMLFLFLWTKKYAGIILFKSLCKFTSSLSKARGYESRSHWGTMVMDGFQIPKTKSVVMVAVVFLIRSWSSLHESSSMWRTFNPANAWQYGQQWCLLGLSWWPVPVLKGF